MLEVEARLKILPIHGGVENLHIHHNVVMNRLAFDSCMRPYRRDVSGRTPFSKANKRTSLVDADFDKLSTVFLPNATGERFQNGYLPPEFYSTH